MLLEFLNTTTFLKVKIKILWRYMMRMLACIDVFNRLCYDFPHSLFGHTEEEYIPDAESVYLHREQHHQPQACTLAQCFQLYTKEEQVMTGPSVPDQCLSVS